MAALGSLWLPILLSAVFVFIASSIIHMASPWHKSDYPALPEQDKVQEALRPFNIPPGDYMVPRPSSGKDMRSPEFLDKLNKGPVAMMTVMPNGMTSMARNFILWFLFLLVVSLSAAIIACHVLPPGAAAMRVFKFTGAIAFIGYTYAVWPMSIWYRRAWSSSIKGTIDGLIYAAITGATFLWLWPR